MQTNLYTRGQSLLCKTLKEAGYLEVSKSGLGRMSQTTCRITRRGHEALHAYEQGLRRLFSERVPDVDESLAVNG